MKKKALALFLATMTAASLFAGCGGNSSSSGGSASTAKEETKEEVKEEAEEKVEEAAEDAKDAVEEAAEEAEATLESGEEAVEEAAEDAKEAVGDAKDAVEDAVEDAAEKAGDAVDDAKEAVEDAADKAGAAVEDAKEAVEDAADEAADAAEEATDAVEEAADEAADAAEDAAEEATDAAEDATDAVEEAADEAADAAEDATDAVEEAADEAADAAEEATDAVEEAANEAADAAEEATDAVEEAADEAADAAEDVAEDAEEAVEDAEEAVEDAADAAEDAAEEAADAADNAKDAVEEAADAAEDVAEDAEEAVEDAAEEAEDAADDAKDAVEEAAEDAADEAEDAVEEAADSAEEAAEEAADAAEDAKDAVEEAADDAEEAVEDVADDAEKAVEEAADAAEETKEAAEETAEEAEEAVEEAADEAADAVGEAAEDAEEAAEDVADDAEKAVEEAEEAVEEAADEAEEAEEAADKAAKETEEAVEEAADEAEEAVEEAADEAEEAVEETADEAEEAVEEAVEETEEAVEEAAEEAEEAVEEAVEEGADTVAPAAAAVAAAAVTLYNSPVYPDGETVAIAPAAYNEAAPDWSEYNELIKQIKGETDTEARVALMHKAEDILMATGAVIPIYYYNDLYVQKTDVEGIYSNLFGFKFFQFATCPRDVLKVNLASEPAKIDPALNSSVDGACLCVNLFSGLYTYDADGNLQPDLADPENPYEVSDDGLVYTFHLQEGLKWSDGSDLTAKDFEYAWKRCADPMTAADYAYMFDCFALNDDGSIMVEATDDLTLVATLNAPCAYFLDLAAFPAYLPVPQAAVEAEADWETNPGAWCAEAGFITNGAYTVSEWKHEESMTFVKNENYHRADEVSIEEIDFMLSADDTAIYAAYQSDDLDFADTVPTNEIESIKDNEDFHVVDNLGTYYAAFNVNSPIFEGKTVDQAIAMRKAFALLIDRDYIIENIGQCEQKVATSYIPEGMADGNGGIFKENTDSYTYPDEEAVGYYPAEWSEEGVEEARALLEYAGFEFTEDGVLSDETPINITYLTNESTGHVAIAEAMQQDFAELGINMSIEQREWNVFLDERKNGQFDFAREGWLADFNDPINMLEMWTTQSGNNDCQFGRDPAAAVEEEAAEE